MKRFLKNNLNNIILIIIYILMFYVFANLLHNIFSGFVTDEKSGLLYSFLINIIIYIILLVSSTILMKKEIVTDFKSLEKEDAVRIFLICLAGVVCVYLGNVIGNSISISLGGVDDSMNQNGIEALMFSDYGVIVAIMTIFMGPIVEELIFRKALHNILRSLKIPTWLLLIISSVLFGLIHVASNGDFIYVFPYIFMGVALGGLEILNKNIYPSIFVHIFINAMATSLIFFMDKIQGIMPM